MVGRASEAGSCVMRIGTGTNADPEGHCPQSVVKVVQELATLGTRSPAALNEQ